MIQKLKWSLTNPVFAAAAGFLLGLIIGLPILGWGLWPVKWTDAAPQHLREDLKEDYLRMAIQSYALQPDPVRAVARWKELGEDAPAILEKLRMDPSLPSNDVIKFSVVVQQPEVALTEEGLQPTREGQLAPTGALVTPMPTQPGTPTGGLILPTTKPAEKEQETSGLSLYLVLLGVFCLLMLILAAALVYLLVLRKRKTGGAPSLAYREAEASRQAVRTDYEAEGQEPPVVQFMTTYMLGDDLYDDSFSIDAPNGEFLGECGVGISETIGVGEPKKVTAVEVWVFDKDDIQTVTKVLMSEYAFNDQTIRQRLASKGEPVEARVNDRVVLETAHLQLVARVVDLSYGQGALPDHSFFDRLTLELAVWRK